MKPLESDAASPERRREERRPARFLRRFEPFQGVTDRKISPPRIRRPTDFPRTTPRTDGVATPFDPARRTLRRRPPNGRGFGEIPIRVRLFSRVCGEEKFRSVPAAASPTLGPLRRARDGEHSGDRARPCEVGPRGACVLGRAASAICDRRPRAMNDSARQRRTRVRQRGFWESMATAVLFIGDRRKRIAQFQIFRN